MYFTSWQDKSVGTVHFQLLNENKALGEDTINIESIIKNELTFFEIPETQGETAATYTIRLTINYTSETGKIGAYENPQHLTNIDKIKSKLLRRRIKKKNSLFVVAYSY